VDLSGKDAKFYIQGAKEFWKYDTLFAPLRYLVSLREIKAEQRTATRTKLATLLKTTKLKT
jgi:hypothetical protein